MNLETQRRLKMTPAQVADEIEALLGVLLPSDPPRRDDGKSHAYAKAWVDAGGIVTIHGVMIVEALRAMEARR